MTQGRKPKPANLKLIQGTNQKCRERPDAPDFEFVKEFPAPPSCLNIDGVDIWQNLGKQLVATKVLQTVDLYILEQLCYTWQRFREKAKAGAELSAAENSAMKGLFSEFGMTPASRTKVKITKPAENEFASFKKIKI